MTDMKQLNRMPAWGTMSQRDYEFYTGKTQLKTRKAIKTALEAEKPVMYKKITRRKYRKDANKLVGSKIMLCECGAEMKVDANAIGVRCYKCTNKMAIKQGGFLHSKTVADQDPQKKEKSMARKKASKKSTKKNSHMSVDAIRDRFDNPDSKRKPGYFVMVFGALKRAGSMTVTELTEKVQGWKSTPEKYQDTEKLEKQVRFYAKNIWGKRTGLVKVDGDTLTYVKPEDRS